MTKMNKRTICLTLAALIMAAGLTVGTAMAYFTTYVTADGGAVLKLGFTDTEIKEEVIAGKKELTLTNVGDFPAYVRIKALVGDEHPVVYSEPQETNGSWELKADGYYEYGKFLAPGESTTQINVGFDLDGNESFNVIIVQESTPVLYDENGEAYCDWSVKADISEIVVPVE